MDITGIITGIEYKPFFSEKLKKYNFKNLDINNTPSTFNLELNDNSFAISKWVSPKRTRSYPFERVYNSLIISKKITIIPVLKDEGKRGDRDYIQWDTVSLMSLLDVFVIFAYYNKAEKNKRNNEKITNQQFDNGYILTKIEEIEKYHSSALHWNLNELKVNFHTILDKAKKSYKNIQETTNVPLHNLSGIDNFKIKIEEDVSNFLEYSRDKAKRAQNREFLTVQPKESLSSISKAKITIINYLGGKYYLTVDEITVIKNTIYLIESKHSSKSLIPSKGDIKDGLLKMILYSNLKDVCLDLKPLNCKPVLLLTSSKIVGSLSSIDKISKVKLFLSNNNFSLFQIDQINILLKEAQENNFILKIQYSK